MGNSVKRVAVTAGVVAIGVALLALSAGPVGAQVSGATETGVRPLLSLTEIEKVANAHGVRVTELEVKDKIVEVEGRDATDREVKLLVDRRSGEVLSRKLED
jgi:hypothetical protein